MTVTARIEVTDEETGRHYIYTGIKAESLTIETTYEEWPRPQSPFLIRRAPAMEGLTFDFTRLAWDAEGIVRTVTEKP